MKLTKNLSITSLIFILSACATEPRKVNMKEVTAHENQFITATKNQTASKQREELYSQPVNKVEPCKVPTNKKLLESRNFRAYWDGDCKDGYAYGLGRDIALSDTNHVEEITIYNGKGYSTGQPLRTIDFVQNSSIYGAVLDPTAGTFSGYNEVISQNSIDFSIQHFVGDLDNSGGRYMQVSLFNPVKTTFNQSEKKLNYVLIDYSALPATSDQAEMVLFAADAATSKPAGFRIVRFRNGVVQHQKLSPDGQTVVELVQLPPEFIAQLQEKIGEAQAAALKANKNAEQAKQMEREYLHMACAGNYSIEGVPAKDMEIARKICTWRDQWKDAYIRAEVKYKQDMEQKQRDVAQTEQQRAYIAAQQAQAAATQNVALSASLNQMNQALQQQNNNTLQQIYQMNQQIQKQNNIMMESWAPQQNKTTVCTRIGNQVFCK